MTGKTAPSSGATSSSKRDTAQTGKGIPPKHVKPTAPMVNKESTAHDDAAQASLALPHERDQSTDMTRGKPARRIQQADQDVKKGRQDTSKSVEMNKAYAKLK